MTKGLSSVRCAISKLRKKGGGRFNENQTNEQRRQPSNLLLMCYPHHVETDDVDKFPVQTMARIKTEHEKKFSDVVGTMLLTVTDHTTLTTALAPQNLNKINEVLKWGLLDEELAESLAELSKIIAKISKVPLPSRELFSILVKRGQDGRFSADLECSIAEIKQATNLAPEELRECFSILGNAGFAFDNDKNDFGVQLVGIAEAKSGWPVWSDLRKFCRKQGIELSLMIEGLDFSSLEG